MKCNISTAETNIQTGSCPIAKCVSNEKYPSDCKRIQRAVLFDGVCCLKLCHLENEKNETCSVLDKIPSRSDATNGYDGKLDVHSCLILVIIFALFMIRN